MPDGSEFQTAGVEYVAPDLYCLRAGPVSSLRVLIGLGLRLVLGLGLVLRLECE